MVGIFWVQLFCLFIFFEARFIVCIPGMSKTFNFVAQASSESFCFTFQGPKSKDMCSHACLVQAEIRFNLFNSIKKLKDTLKAVLVLWSRI